MKSVIFVPVFNQIIELPRGLDEIKKAPRVADAMLFVNNGCTDGSQKLIHESGFPFIDLPQNLGVGYSFMVAVDWALKNNYEIFGSMASNGKMIASEMPRILDPILNGEVDYVTGSRFLAGGESPNLPAFRRTSIPLVNTFVKALTGISLTDATCGYRAMKTEIFTRATFDWHSRWLNTYGFEYYIYAKVILDGSIRWKEVPITMRYPQRGMRYSKIKPFSGWYQMLKPWVVARWDRRGFDCPHAPISLAFRAE
jgi:dolichol-phosphate mannosyltransferase